MLLEVTFQKTLGAILKLLKKLVYRTTKWTFQLIKKVRS